ncbi:CRISPR-associated helicase Cas3' [Streptomyces sp. NPDC020883]|uniref:CRISPR-associated helicase Cas3' n=1 Tax=Streptomyces sp. NPDC020883 TaxID=3365099 RepID=UPI0037B5FAED
MDETEENLMMGRSPWWLWLLAKTDRHGLSRHRGGPLWNPLLAHAMDTAAVCGELFDQYLATPTQERLAEAYGGGCEATARTVLMLLTALHDLGKAIPGWQRTFLNTPSTDPELQQAAHEWAGHPRRASLLTDDDWSTARSAPHQHVTARYLPALLRCPCCTEEPGERHEGLHRIAALLGGHHGHIPSAADLRAAGIGLTPAWEAIHRALLNQLADLLRLDLAALPQLIDPTRPIALIHLAGLTVLCDWVASDESRFPYRAGGSPTQWWAHARKDAAHAIRDLHLQRWLPAHATWAKLLPNTPTPRPLQQAVIDAAPTNGPTLAIIESTTGSGKTEIALWLAHHLATHNGYHGFYLAQATRLATEQLASRCARFLAQAAGGRHEANLAIVTGTASISATATELQQHKGMAQLASSINLTDDDCTNARAVLDEWFLQTGRGLLSPFGIGTVDQIVLAAQKYRHWFLRLFGIAQKTVIIDEAHAYEMYQQRLLGTAIAWLAEAGASVIILSATLPTSIRNDLITAWCTGHRTIPRQTAASGPVTFVDAHGNSHHTRPAQQTAPLRTDLHLREDDGPEALAEHLLTSESQDAVTGVIRNHLGNATDLHNCLVRQAAHRSEWDPKHDFVLLHSLFLERDRARIQNRLLAALGPHPDEALRSTCPNPNRPDRLIVVGTQVLEQSLDIDFDLLYSDLAPIDLIIQRRGRLWRHLLNRPHLADAVPALNILWEPHAPHLPKVRHTDGKPTGVYAPFIQAATWHALHRRGALPGPLRITTGDHSTGAPTATLIHEVYSSPPPAGSEPIHALLADAYDAWQHNLARQEQEALDRAVQPYSYGEPCGIESLASGPSHGHPDDDDKPLHLIARSRLGDPSVNVVGLYQHTDGTRSWDPEGHLVADLTRYHPYREAAQHRAQQRDILLNSMPLPHRWFHGRARLPHPSTWTVPQAGALARRPVLLLRPDGTCLTQGVEHLKYSPRTGLSTS